MIQGIRIAIVALALCLCACSKVDENLKPVDLVKFEPSVSLKKRWSQSIGAGHDRFYNRFRVALQGDRLFAADDKGGVFALNASNGKVVWKTHLDTAIGGAVGASPSSVLVGTLKGEVIALDANTGKERWRVKTTSSLVTPPQGTDSTVIALTNDNRLFAFDALSGKQLWTYDHSMPVLTYRTQATPVIVDDQVFVGFDNGQLLSFALTDGQLRWSTRVAQPKGRTELNRMVDIDSTPIVDGPFVYAGCANGRLVAINRSTGRISWGQNLSTLFDIAKSGDQIFASADDSHVLAFNSASGEPAWENKQLHRRNISAPGVLGEYIAVIDDEDYLHLLNQKDGSFAGRLKPSGSGFHAPMLTLDNSIVLFGDDGTLSAYSLQPLNGK
ncbi:MAG TPA: outer membrane protein assembly factor BamB [Cellvibrionaceae bacterium]